MEAVSTIKHESITFDRRDANHARQTPVLGCVIVTRLAKLDLIKDKFANLGRHSLLLMHDGVQNIWKQQIIYLWHFDASVCYNQRPQHFERHTTNR